MLSKCRGGLSPGTFMMLIGIERNCISKCNFAGFLIVGKNVLSCPVNEIHTVKPEVAYYAGKMAFSR
jgi:predicted amidohydrolase YtcJ